MSIVGQFIFAAADIPSHEYIEKMTRYQGRIAKRKTEYTSRTDSALKMSMYYNSLAGNYISGDELPAGLGCGIRPADVDCIEAILRGHSYIFDNPIAILDLKELISSGRNARDRGLETIEKSGHVNYILR